MAPGRLHPSSGLPAGALASPPPGRCGAWVGVGFPQALIATGGLLGVRLEIRLGEKRDVVQRGIALLYPLLDLDVLVLLILGYAR